MHVKLIICTMKTFYNYVKYIYDVFGNSNVKVILINNRVTCKSSVNFTQNKYWVNYETTKPQNLYELCWLFTYLKTMLLCTHKL